MSTRLFRPLVWVCLLALLPAMPGFAADSEVFSLGEVIVTGEQQVVNLATTVTEVTEEDIKQRGAQTVAEALELLPGINVAVGGKGQSYVSVRGFEQSELKVLIDGVPLYEQFYREIDLSQIPVDAIAKITVTKGASSVLYGANTLGGVINIVTKTAGAKPTAEVIASWGNYATQNYIFNTGATLGKFNYWLTTSFRQSDGYRLSNDFDSDPMFIGEHTVDGTSWVEDGGKRDSSNYIKRTINAKLGWQPDQDTSLYLTFDYHNNPKGVPNRSWRFNEWEQWHVNLVGEKRINDWLRVKARGYYVDHKDVLVEEDPTFTADHKHFWLASAYDNYTVGGELQTFMDFGPLSFLKIGMSFFRDDCEQSEIPKSGGPWEDVGEFSADTYSLGIEDEIQLNDWLAITLGASYDYFDPREANDQPVPDSIDDFNPQIGAVATLTENTTLHGSISQKIRFPHLKELFSKASGGNPNLEPQKTQSYEIGVTHSFSDRVNGSVAFFYNDIEDLIDKVGPKNASYYTNIGQAHTQGIEASLSADVTDNFWMGFNYTYLETEQRTDDEWNGRELEGRPRHRANLDLRYRFGFGLTASTQASYTQRQYYEDNDDNWKQGPDFFLLNARLEQNLGRKWDVEGKVFVEVSNITDKFYHEEGFLTPGRTFLAGLSLTY